MQKNPEWYDSCHKSSVRKQRVGLIGFSSFSRFHQGAYYSGTRLVLFRELFLMMSSQTAPLHPVFNQVGYSVALSMTFAAKLRITFQTSRMVFRFRFVSCLSICLSCPVYLSVYRVLSLTSSNRDFSFQCVASFFYLYFACLTPIVTFGGLLSDATGKNMGAIESLLSGNIA